MDVKPTYHLSITFDLRLTEQQARALTKMDDWGVDVVVKNATAHIPESEAAPVRAGLKSFLQTVGEQLDPCLYIVDQQRRDIHEAERRREEFRRARQREDFQASMRKVVS